MWPVLFVNKYQNSEPKMGLSYVMQNLIDILKKRKKPEGKTFWESLASKRQWIATLLESFWSRGKDLKCKAMK